VNITTIVKPSNQTGLNGLINTEGTISFDNLISGSYTLQAKTDGYELESVPFILSGCDSLDVNFHLRKIPLDIPGYPIESMFFGLTILFVFLLIRPRHP